MTHASTTDYLAAVRTVARSLEPLDENGDFGHARDSEPYWPTTLEGTAIRALRALRDALFSRAAAMPALDRLVKIATWRELRFAPDLITVALHTPGGLVAIEGRPLGPRVHAPEFPELALPTYTFTGPHTGLTTTTDLETFLAALAEALEREPSQGGFVLTVHADVLGWDFDDAYAWRYDPHTNSFESVLPDDAASMFHEDTHVYAYPWDKAPFTSVSAIAPDEPPELTN